MEKNIDKSIKNISVEFNDKCNIKQIEEQTSSTHPLLPIQLIFNILTYNYEITSLYQIRNYSKSIRQSITKVVVENVKYFCININR